MFDFNNFLKFQENLPFISGISYNDSVYVGIIHNVTIKMVSFYNFELIKDPEQRKRFLEYGECWWEESNRTIPISIFLSSEMLEFNHIKQTFMSKETKHLFGPAVSLDNIPRKRIKRKQIQIVRKM